MSRPIAADGTIRLSTAAALALPVIPVVRAMAAIPLKATDIAATQNTRSSVDRLRIPFMSTSIV
jgi:hypothetical protein